MCFPTSTAEVQACVRAARRHGRPFVARGSGTGLAGGAVPLDGPVVIVTTKMNRVLSVDAEATGWRGCEPGRAQPRPVEGGGAARPALRARPVEPAELLDRRQRRQQLRRSALPRLRRHQRPRAGRRGGAARRHVDGARRRGPEPAGSTCAARSSAARACSASPPRIAVRLTPNPPAVRTMLLDFDTRRRRRRDGERRSSPPGSCPPPSR